MSYFIDTNIFLRVLIKEDERSFRECSQFLNLVRQKKIEAFTSPLVFAEIDWVIESFYKFERQEAIKSLDSILKLKGLKITNGINISLTIEFYKRYNIKFIDALIASISKIAKREMTIVSYDEDFDKLKVKKLEPKQVLKAKRIKK